MHPGVENLDQLREQAKAGLESDQAKTLILLKLSNHGRLLRSSLSTVIQFIKKIVKFVTDPRQMATAFPMLENFVKR